MAEKIPSPENNGNDLKAALERAKAEQREREIKAIEKHLQENGENKDPTEPHAKAKNPRTKKTGKVRHQLFSPRNKPVRDYDEDGRPFSRPVKQVHSWEPEIRKESELNRKASRKKNHRISSVIDTPGFVKVETKPGASWTETEPKAREPRVRPPVAVEINNDPAIQVETKSVPNPEADAQVFQFATAPAPGDLIQKDAIPAASDFLTAHSADARLSNSEPSAAELPSYKSSDQQTKAAFKAQFNKRAVEVAEMLKGRSFGKGEINPIAEARMYMDFGRDAQAMEVLEETARKVADGTYAASAQSAEPARESAESIIEEGKLLTLEEIKHTLEEQLKNNPDVLNITNVKIEEEDGGLRMNVAITTAGGKATINGLVVNDVNGLSMRDLDVDANLLIRGRVKNAFSDFSSVIKSRLAKQYGKSISSIQIGKSGINVEFEHSQVDRGSINGIEPAIISKIDIETVTAIPNPDKPTESESRRFNLLNYVKNRKGQLEKKSEEMGLGIKAANFVRNTGEWYRKLPLKYKIGVAGALLGMNVATGGASTLVTLLTSTAMIGQRALGAASAYALIDGLYEKRLTRKEKERGSERTEFEKWKKRGYSTATALAVFTGLPGYTIKEGFDAIGGGGMLKALGALMGTSPAVTELTPTTPAPTGASAGPSVEETAKIMQQAKEQLVKEVTARDEIQAGLDQVKQQIVEEKAKVIAEASTPQESRQALRTAVEKLTRASATVDAKFEMPKHADFSIHEDDTEISPYDVTPTDQSGTDDMLSTAEEIEEQPQPAETVTETTVNVEPEEIVIKQPTGTPMADVTGEQATAEVPTEASTSAQETVTNSSGLNVPTTESHVYSGSGDRLYVFGGTTADHSRTIREFFSEPENAKKILYTPPVTGGSHVIGWIKSPDGAIMSSGPLEAEERSWFGMKKYVEKIEPDLLRKLIK